MSQSQNSPVHPQRHLLLDGIDLAAVRALEIGALTAPSLVRPGVDVLYADHADTAALRAKYADHPDRDPARFVEVDIVWPGGPLRPLLGAAPPFDLVFASHVIEHVPDMIGWLAALAEVVRPGGRLCLAIPDQRFTFDVLRRPTGLPELLDAHLRGNRRPMPAQVFDHHANVVMLDREAAWRGAVDPAALEHYATPAQALQMCQRAMAGEYIDVHCWVFTPHSLMTLLGGLATLGLLAWRCAAFHPTEPLALEMLLVLERAADGADPAGTAAGFAASAARLPC